MTNTYDKEAEIKSLHNMLKIAQDGIAEALKEIGTSKELVRTANIHLQTAQEENRKLKQIILKLSEVPDPEECADLIDLLEHPCGFVNCQRSERAVNCIRAFIRANTALKDEIERLRKDGTSEG